MQFSTLLNRRLDIILTRKCQILIISLSSAVLQFCVLLNRRFDIILTRNMPNSYSITLLCMFAVLNNIIINIIIICKRYYIETLIKELGLDNSSTTTGNSTYTPCEMSSEDIVNTHDTFMKSFGIELSDDDKRLPYLYWTPKLHKSPVKHRFIAGSSKCTTKQLSSLLPKSLQL